MRRLNYVTCSDGALSCAFDGGLLERAREVPIVWHTSKRTNHNCRFWTQCLNADLTLATGEAVYDQHRWCKTRQSALEAERRK
ncbi:hypothetical protein NSND_63029 [Nitrospira sp. ND1]|nr:hypothetical protein NSND_63029 [Nitrospira sp. ND1]